MANPNTCWSSHLPPPGHLPDHSVRETICFFQVSKNLVILSPWQSKHITLESIVVYYVYLTNSCENSQFEPGWTKLSSVWFDFNPNISIQHLSRVSPLGYEIKKYGNIRTQLSFVLFEIKKNAWQQFSANQINGKIVIETFYFLKCLTCKTETYFAVRVFFRKKIQLCYSHRSLID